jgi:Tol biopolymer transport system component
MDKSYKIFFIFFMIISNLYAQVPNNPLGLNPHRLRWSQINTDKVQVIFPAGLDAQGQRAANLVQYLWDNDNESIGDKRRKATILLQNQTTIPNGFVTVGPFRSECYVTPPQFNINGAGDWLDLLVIHEYRHIKQFANSNRGITRLAKGLFGSWTWGGFFGLALPRWYLEGDATATETALTHSGRGRLPEFDMEYRALASANIHYKYEKASAGSLKHFVPNHYNLGYYLTVYGRRNYGNELWQKVTNNATAYKGLLYPFGRNLRKEINFRTPQFYKKAFDDLENQWRSQSNTQEISPARKVNQTKKQTFTDYKNAQYIDNQTLIAEKSSFRQIRTFYKIDSTGKEKRLFLPGLNVGNNTTLSHNNGMICWAELTYDARWGNKNFSIIRTYSLQNGELNKVTARSRYFAPALSPSAGNIVAVEVTEDLRYSLVILNTFSGDIVRKLPNLNNYFYSFPRWTDDGKSIVAVAQQGEHNWIEKVDAESGASQELTNRSNHQITNPAPRGEYVYFAGAHTGINNIFAVKTTGDKALYQVTSVSLGAFQPTVSPDGKKLTYSNFTAMGYDLHQIELKPEIWKSYNESQPSQLDFIEPLAEKSGGSILTKIPTEKFAVKKFGKLSGIINPHSLLPYLYPPVVGLRLLSDNKFSTLSAEFASYYNLNEREFTHSAEVNFAEFFPVLKAGFAYSNRAKSVLDLRANSDTSLRVTPYTAEWREQDVYVGVNLPINFTRGAFFNQLQLGLDYHFLNLETQNAFDDPENRRINVAITGTNRNPNQFREFFSTPLTNQSVNAVDLRLRLSSYQTTAQQNILPRWGGYGELRYQATLNNDDVQGSVFYSRFDLYLPGLKRTHNFYINTAYQQQLYTDNYQFRNLFFYARGYGSTPFSDEVTKIGFNYAFPLLYPDMAVGSFVFLKRIKANLFYDYSLFRVTEPHILNTIYGFGSEVRASTGVEITFDFRALRILEVDLGFRYSYLLNATSGRNYQIDFLLFRIGI